MESLKNITNKLFLVAGIIFAIFSILSFSLVKSISIFIGGMTISILCIVFQYIFNVKWSKEARESLLEASEKLKGFGDCLPLSFLGKLQYVWIVLLIISFIKPLATALIPSIPSVLFVVINNVSFSFFLIGVFYQLLQGNLKGISTTTGIFAIYNILDVIYTFVLESKTLSIRAMCLFLAFWVIHQIFSVMMAEEDPNPQISKPNKKSKKEIKEPIEDTKEEVVNDDAKDDSTTKEE